MKLNGENSIKVGELPDLKIMPIEKVTFHEEPDRERSTSLGMFIQKDGRLKNPPVVAYYENGAHIILLDGANRITALRGLNIKDVLVQRVNLFDPGLLFLNWHHAVEKYSKKDFLDKLYQIKGLNIEQKSGKAIEWQDEADQLTQIQFHDEIIYKVTANCDIYKKVDLLNKITDIYKGSAYMDRVSYTSLEHLRMHYPNFCAILCFKKFSKEELIKIIENGSKLPSGITRIILPKRALRLNVPLDILRFESPDEEKNHWLQKRIKLQVKDRSIRFYHEPTFLFDE